MVNGISARIKALHVSPFLLEPDLKNCVEMLARAYAEYMGYVELGFDEENARQKAELQDNLKFKTAYHAWKLCHFMAQS